MARKALKNEKNISYDDEKKKYYVCFDYGKDESGKRKKQYTQTGDWDTFMPMNTTNSPPCSRPFSHSHPIPPPVTWRQRVFPQSLTYTSFSYNLHISCVRKGSRLSCPYKLGSCFAVCRSPGSFAAVSRTCAFLSASCFKTLFSCLRPNVFVSRS